MIESAAEQQLDAQASGTAFVTITGGEVAAQRVALVGDRMLVGRAPDADIRLDRNTVSRHHAELFRDPFGRWWARDLGSRNGIRFGDRRISERALQIGDALQIGEFVLSFSPPLGDSTVAPARTTLRTSDAQADIRSLQDLEQPKVAAGHLSVLIDFGRELLETDDAVERLARLCRLMLREEFGGRFAAALRSSGDGAAEVLCGPVTAAGWHHPPYVSRRLVQAVQETGRPALASNCAEGPEVVQMTIAAPVASSAAIACPLPSGTGRSDLLYVGLPPERGTTEWLAIASLAAEQYRSAESIWAARLQAQAHAAIERELQQASQIQARLLPTGVHVPGLEVEITFRPCRWVGGDYVGVRPLDEARVLLTVADVCGKGLPAALVASSLHTMLFASLRAGAGLAELMDSLNTYINEFPGVESFVTMACVLLDVRSGELLCANAGHPPPLIAAPDGTVRPLPSGQNFPLGVAPAPISCQQDRLNTGELLVMYTDGVTESRTPAGALLSVEGLGQELAHLYGGAAQEPLSVLAGRLATRLDELQDGLVARDDVTLLLARAR